jgi:preprotein translocase subunit SecE
MDTAAEDKETQSAETKKSDRTQEKSKGNSWFKGLKAEFSKIIWPAKEKIIRESATVVIITFILGVLIALIDTAVKAGYNFMIG